MLAVILVLVPGSVAGVLAGTTLPAWADDPVGVWPLRPVPPVAQGFDPPDSPYGAGHRGVDLVGRPGEAVRSALPGVVTYAGLLAGRGVVVVDHGPTRTTYEPVSAVVGLGTRVLAGQRIGTLEAAPSHCAPRACLHWGWIAGASTYLDPLRLVGADGPVRLLPLTGDPDPPGPGASTPRLGPVEAPSAAAPEVWARSVLALLGRVVVA